MTMKTRLTKWGNSLAVRLPKLFAIQMGVDEGEEVVVQFDGKNIVIEKDQSSLQSLLHNVNDENIHREIDSGPPQGSEIW
jgi:antitoxin MazE